MHKLLYIPLAMLSILVASGCSAPTSSGYQPGQSNYAVFAAQWKAKGVDSQKTVVGALSLHIGNQTTLLTGSVMHEADGSSSRVFGTLKDFSIALPTGSVRCSRLHTSGDVITGTLLSLQETKRTGIWSMHMVSQPEKITAFAFDGGDDMSGGLILQQNQRGSLTLPNGNVEGVILQRQRAGLSIWFKIGNSPAIACVGGKFTDNKVGMIGTCQEAGIGWNARELSFL
jgi:hypothetical protein